jgi:hypothetical protein
MASTLRPAKAFCDAVVHARAAKASVPARASAAVHALAKGFVPWAGLGGCFNDGRRRNRAAWQCAIKASGAL